MKKFLVILTILSMILGVGSSFAQENELSQKVSSLADKLAFAVEGYVVGTADEVVYIDLGQDAGIVEGVKFEVVRLDKEHPFKKDERIIGYPETEVGEIEITKVRKGMSIAKITKKNMEIQKDDKVYQKIKKVTRVAITEFTYGDKFNDFTKGIQDILYTNLIQKGMTVVEREKLEQVLEEQKISFTGMIDLATATKIGKMLGVEAIVVGTVADMGNYVDIRARLIDVEKGTAITAAQVEVVKNPTIIGILGTGTKRAVYGTTKTTVTEEEKETIGKVTVNQAWTENTNWKATLVSYQLLEDRTLQFNLLIENLQDKPAACKFYSSDSRTYLLDNLANKYFNPATSVPEEGMELIQKMPVKFRVSFPKLKKGVKAVVLYLYWSLWDGGYERSRRMYFGPIKLE